MDKSKVQAVADWQTPKRVPELRSFLGFINYYRCFIARYSNRAAPLTELLKKEQSWRWSEKCEATFQDVKNAVLEEPILRLPDYGKSFEVHTNASDFAIGGVLMQEGHPMAYESHKLNETERRYPMHEKEMTVKLSPKQARWQDFLAKFDMVIEYKPRKANVVADALSQKVELVNAIQLEGRGQASQLHSNFLSRIRGGLYRDPQDKVEQQKPVGLLEPLPILERPWESISLNFISSLPVPTSLHPQTDGQTERINSFLEQYLRHYVSANQRDWVKLLDIAQFSYNLQRSSASNKSPFEIITGQQPLTPHTLVIGYTGSCPSAYRFAKEWHRNADIARAYLENVTKKMKMWTDLGRRPQEFKVGDMVLVKLQPASLQFFRHKVHKGLVHKYKGSFPIISRVDKVSYKLQLPAWFRIHNVFYASNLKAYHSDP
ncbi:hypothetical protein OPV22_032479 [Ensete ventricosum]|uniref:Integrase catalytic domain-containing protein n=1 Tax=Ensete ventricosum TaxID=4639 RepID=A0AAV8PRJ9_ENSVE|nr:hypothetical protein OPV22_032479 [Ensete ventricosum]